jgi:hypothetical protein
MQQVDLAAAQYLFGVRLLYDYGLCQTINILVYIFYVYYIKKQKYYIIEDTLCAVEITKYWIIVNF